MSGVSSCRIFERETQNAREFRVPSLNPKPETRNPKQFLVEELWKSF